MEHKVGDVFYYDTTLGNAKNVYKAEVIAKEGAIFKVKILKVICQSDNLFKKNVGDEAYIYII